MKAPWRDWRAPQIGIDLGTSHTAIYRKGLGITTREPSIISVKSDPSGGESLIAAGSRAKKMRGRTPKTIRCIEPLEHGAISDLHYAEAMLNAFLQTKRIPVKPLASRPALLAIPSDLSKVEKRAATETVSITTRRRVRLIKKTIAAAIGADLPVQEATGSMVVDIGGGTTEVAVISLGGVVLSKVIRVGGQKFDQSIESYLRSTHSLLIGPNAAERIKRQIGTARETQVVKRATARGLDVLSGLPGCVDIKSDELQWAIADDVTMIAEGIHEVLEKAPPEISGDIYSSGVTLTGAGSLLRNLPRDLEHRLGIGFRLAPEPSLATALGLGRCIEDPRLTDRVFDDIDD